jgi:hypothetical protein
MRATLLLNQIARPGINLKPPLNPVGSCVHHTSILPLENLARPLIPTMLLLNQTALAAVAPG